MAKITDPCEEAFLVAVTGKHLNRIPADMNTKSFVKSEILDWIKDANLKVHIKYKLTLLSGGLEDRLDTAEDFTFGNWTASTDEHFVFQNESDGILFKLTWG